jgi:hypothetical protein
LLFQIEQRADQGLPPKSKKFSTIIDDYIRFRERDHQHGKTSAGMLRQIIRVSKFWREYAGEMAVDAIDDKVMREFISWRRDYYASAKNLPKNAKRHLTDKTLQWDMMLGKAIVRWAHEQGLRGGKPLPTVTFTEETCATCIRALGVSNCLRWLLQRFRLSRQLSSCVRMVTASYAPLGGPTVNWAADV